jgi:hypothetical protein
LISPEADYSKGVVAEAFSTPMNRPLFINVLTNSHGNGLGKRIIERGFIRFLEYCMADGPVIGSARNL